MGGGWRGRDAKLGRASHSKEDHDWYADLNPCSCGGETAEVGAMMSWLHFTMILHACSRSPRFSIASFARQDASQCPRCLKARRSRAGSARDCRSVSEGLGSSDIKLHIQSQAILTRCDGIGRGLALQGFSSLQAMLSMTIFIFALCGRRGARCRRGFQDQLAVQATHKAHST